MPLRDHFRPPVSRIAPWVELHSGWPMIMAMRLNSILPRRYRSGPNVSLGGAMSVDIGSGDLGSIEASPAEFGAGGMAWRSAAPTLLLDTDELEPPEFEVRVYDDERQSRLVAAVELVSPANKDRAETRDQFVAKCRALLYRGVCVTVVDLVTERSANLYADLAERIGADPPSIAGAPLYAVTCRVRSAGGRYRVETWAHALAVGEPLPIMPLWVSEAKEYPLELEFTYEETCRGLRIA